MNRALPAVAPVLLGLGMGALLGCASSLANQAGPGWSTVTDAERVWAALAEGRDDDAQTLLDQRPPTAIADVSTSFGEATLAFERGDVPRALSAYLAVLESAPAIATSSSSLFAAMAAGRVGTLLEEYPGPDDGWRAIEDRIARLTAANLSWEARFAVANLQDRTARRGGDPELLARVAREAGCLGSFVTMPSLGRLPHLDLDRPDVPDITAEAPGSVVRASGCRASIPSFEDRAGVERLRAEIQIREPGTFDVILSFRGEARVIVDHGSPRRHGEAYAYGPWVSATRVVLTKGLHLVELRLGTYGGRPELAVMVIPAASAGEALGAAAPVSGPGARVAELLGEAYVANQLGDVARSEAAAALLEASPKLAVGQALAGALVRDDPSLPAGFSRDRARALLRRALSVDARLARARNALAGLALEDERPREALDEARLAAAAAPRWWLPRLTLHAAYGMRGLEWDADRALDEALILGPRACAVVEAALSRAETRRDGAAVRRYTDDGIVCGKATDDRISRLRRRGDLDEAERLLRLGMALEPDPAGMRRDLARLLLGRGRAREAMALLDASLGRTDGEATVLWADAAIAAGERSRAQARVAALLDERPDQAQIVRTARVLGVPLPLDDYRLEGREVIRSFERSRRRYAAPAVVVLDRSVTRVFPSGAEMTLTHEIVRLQSKDAIQKWGEVSVPEGAEVLTLRTHKVDGTTREPEEVAGKDAISAADLAIGDYLEKETLEISPPREAFAPAQAGARPGYLGDRFYFQSFDAPLDRSEYLLVTDPETADALHIDARAGAPAPDRGPPRRRGGRAEVVTSFVATRVPQLFAERSSVPAIEHVPSVRISMGASWGAWGRFLSEQMYGTARDASVLAGAEAEIRARARTRPPRELAAALLAWVGKNVEGDDDLRGAATQAVASGRGNRTATVLALAHRLGLRARPALGRSRFVAAEDAPTPIEEADDFAETLVRFELPQGEVVYVDPRLKHAPFGYLSPGLEGARVLDLASGTFDNLPAREPDTREVEVTVHLAPDGHAEGNVSETVRGWPALEWAEIVDRVGADQTKLRQDFEQRWLGIQFPGATLQGVEVEILGTKRATLEDAANTSPTGDGPSREGPGIAAAARVRYSFASARFAAVEGHRLRVLPGFFRSQPARRYATEPRRSTGLMTGFDVPTTVVARIFLPDDARIEGAPAETHVTESVGQYRFREERVFEPGARAPAAPATPPSLTLRREARMAIMRVPAGAYPRLAQDLRAAESNEAEEIVIHLAGHPAGKSR